MVPPTTTSSKYANSQHKLCKNKKWSHCFHTALSGLFMFAQGDTHYAYESLRRPPSTPLHNEGPMHKCGGLSQGLNLLDFLNLGFQNNHDPDATPQTIAHPRSTQKTPRRHQTHFQEAARMHPGCIQEAADGGRDAPGRPI